MAQEYYGGTDALDLIVEKLGLEGAVNFCLGCVIKYCYRAGKKPGEPAIKDFDKCEDYLKLIDLIIHKYSSKESISPSTFSKIENIRIDFYKSKNRYITKGMNPVQKIKHMLKNNKND